MYKTKQDKIISSIRASKLVKKDYLAYLVHIRVVKIETPSIGSIYVMSELSEVFPNDVPGIPLIKDINFLLT